MARENIDDHNRSNRYTARDFAFNYLNSCKKNAIIFTNGDNDTFPLWYIQEVEEVRQDVRVCNLSYIGADWYIDQMKRKAYTSDTLPISYTQDQYRQGNKDFLYVVDLFGRPMELKLVMDAIHDSKQMNQLKRRKNLAIDNFMPADKLKITIDSASVSGIVPPEFQKDIVKEMVWSINKRSLIKNDYIVLNIIANAAWHRPVYYAITVSPDAFMNLEKYFVKEGYAYRLLPVQVGDAIRGTDGFDTDLLYDKIMNVYRWGNAEKPGVYLNEDNRRLFSNSRNDFNRLAAALLAEGKKDSAKKVVDRCVELIPNEKVAYRYFMIPVADIYFSVNDSVNGKTVSQIILKNATQYLQYLAVLGEKADDLDYEKNINLMILDNLLEIALKHNQAELIRSITAKADALIPYYEKLIGDHFMLKVAEGYYLSNDTLQADKLLMSSLEKANSVFNYILQMPPENRSDKNVVNQKQAATMMLYEIQRIAGKHKRRKIISITNEQLAKINPLLTK
jgi:hypothetical protein